MNPELWGRVEGIVAEALEVDEPERSLLVEERCAGDGETLTEVRRLLQAGDRMDARFLESPAFDPARETYGQYRALHQVGRGGMSVVYLGERTGAEFERRVAIKVMLAPSALTRGETHILASLEHPNIARLFDAGATASGFRYLVMEYVDGVRIDHYCRGLSHDARLRLFLQVCAGVQYANRAFVVHRDLKPANILVTGEGMVKLLDFGIAKLLEDNAVSDHTARAWTPDYASPEQILGEPVTASTDVYSLGVLLCELISGARPRSSADLPLGEIVRRAAAEEIANPGLDGELGLIARKALRRNPAHRYESAGDMARDIERLLEGRPIAARPPSRFYNARKFIGRHRLAVAAGALAVAGLLVTTAVAVRESRLATERFGQVRRLASSVLFEVYPEVSKLSNSLEARQILARRSLEYLDALASDPRAGAGLLTEIAHGYIQLADIQGTSGMESLGDTGAALERARQAERAARRALALEPRNPGARAVLFEALVRLASTHNLRGGADKAGPYAEEAVRVSKTILAEAPGDLSGSRRVAEGLLTLAITNSAARETLAASIPLFDSAVAAWESLSARTGGAAQDRRDLARAHQYAVAALIRLDHAAEAEKHARESRGINEARLAAGDLRARLQLATDLGYLAVIAWRRNDSLAAADLFERQLVLRRALAAEEPRDNHMAMSVAGTMARLGHTYAMLGRFPEAIAMGQDALRRQRAIHARDPKYVSATRELFFALIDLAETNLRAEKSAEACPLVREAAGVWDLLQASSTPMERGPGERLKKMRARCGV
ncbi:MAG: serine/threonine-protein kinase [Bryobacteraceae bacterium]